MNLSRCLCMALLFACAAASPQPAVRAQTGAEAGFQGYLQLLAARARSEGVSEATILRMTQGLSLNWRVVELDRDQPGSSKVPPPIAPYIREHVDSARIRGGRNLYNQVAGTVGAIER